MAVVVIHVAICLLLVTLVCLYAAEVKIVDGKDSDAMASWSSNSWYDSDGYGSSYDSYDSYGGYGGYGGYGNYWDEDDMSDGSAEDEKVAGKAGAPSKVLTNSNVTGPLMMVALQEQCFTTPEIPGEGWYTFCPFRNVSLTYMMRRTEESLAMGWFSHWTTQNLNGTVRLAQVYKDGFYCRMGDEHSTVVTFGCQDEADPNLRSDDTHGNAFVEEGADGGEKWPSFNISSVTRGTYNKDSGNRASINGTMLKGEADYWSAEDTGCVYNLHFVLPFSCADLGPLGFSAPADKLEPKVAVEEDSSSETAVASTAEMDGTSSQEEEEHSPSGEEVLTAWREWDVRLKDGLGASAEEIGRLQQQLNDFRSGISAAARNAESSTSASEESTSSTTSSSSASSPGVSGLSLDSSNEDKKDSSSPSCSCCDELSEVKSKLKQLV